VTLAKHIPGGWLTRLIVVVVCLGMNFCASVHADDATEFKPEDIAFYREKVRPLLKARCDKCHGATVTEPKGGLRLHARTSALTGGDSGPAIVPGDTAESLLIQAINYDGLEMPPRSKLPAGEIAILTRWVRIGLPWPPGDVHVQVDARSISA
jgi:hypothetical protein